MQPMRGRFDKIALALVGGAALVAGGAYLLTAEQHYAERREIASTLSAPALWSELATAFRDSTQSALWPQALEVLRSDGLAEGATVHATYRTPGGESRQAYTIGEFVDGQGFTYATGPEHPLAGGGRVLVLPTPDGGGSGQLTGRCRVQGSRRRRGARRAVRDGQYPVPQSEVLLASAKQTYLAELPPVTPGSLAPASRRSLS